MSLTHINAEDEVNMVDVAGKAVTSREARARAVVKMSPATLRLVAEDAFKKGNVVAAAKLAGIMAAKQTSNLIPLCHPLMLSTVEVDITLNEDASELEILSLARVEGKTGVEMEALTAASVAALTVYDMCKSAEKGIVIAEIALLSKSGGKSGDWERSAV